MLTWWRRYLVFGLILAAVCMVSFAAGLNAQSALEGRAYESGGGTQIKVLFDGPRQDTPVDVAEITFPPGTNTGNHPHGVAEIFYMLEGELEHVVNGESQLLRPGMVGYVKPPDLVNHIVSPDGVAAKALVIWAPGGEAARITSRWRRVE